MSFDLANALSMFQHYVNDILHLYLDVFCTAYIDNILIYSDNLTEHQKHIKLILQIMRNISLQLNVNKCKFHKTEVLYLSLLISTEEIHMNSVKIEIILK